MIFIVFKMIKYHHLFHSPTCTPTHKVMVFVISGMILVPRDPSNVSRPIDDAQFSSHGFVTHDLNIGTRFVRDGFTYSVFELLDGGSPGLPKRVYCTIAPRDMHAPLIRKQ